jgi:hypothetical protein
MTDNQVGIICATIAFVVFMAVIAFKIWLEYRNDCQDDHPH